MVGPKTKDETFYPPKLPHARIWINHDLAQYFSFTALLLFDRCVRLLGYFVGPSSVVIIFQIEFELL